MALHTYIYIYRSRHTCTDRPTRTDTYLLPPHHLQTYSPPARFTGRAEAGDAAENHAEPAALLWFNSAAKASPRQAPAHHVMTCCASDSPARSCGLPEERYRQRHKPKRRWGGETGSGIWWWCQAAVSPVSIGGIGAVGSDLRRSL